MTPFAIAGIQIHVATDHENLGHITERVNHLMFLFPWVQMVILPELAAFGPSPAKAQPLPGPAEETLCRIAAKHQIWFIPGSLFEKTTDGKIGREAFIYNEAEDSYTCPRGARLKRIRQSSNRQKGGMVKRVQYGQAQECFECPLRLRCVKGNAKQRMLTRDEYEHFREEMRERMASDRGKAIYRKRGPIVEGAYSLIKCTFGIRRFARRGLDNVKAEFSLISTAFNIRRMLRNKELLSAIVEID